MIICFGPPPCSSINNTFSAPLCFRCSICAALVQPLSGRYAPPHTLMNLRCSTIDTIVCIQPPHSTPTTLSWRTAMLLHNAAHRTTHVHTHTHTQLLLVQLGVYWFDACMRSVMIAMCYTTVAISRSVAFCLFVHPPSRRFSHTLMFGLAL
jgi:hypothetical protein